MAAHVILLVLWRCHAAKTVTKAFSILIAHLPLVWNSCFCHPIKFGSLALFTKPSSHVIELVQQYTSLLMVKQVFFSPSLTLS